MRLAPPHGICTIDVEMEIGSARRQYAPNPAAFMLRMFASLLLLHLFRQISHHGFFCGLGTGDAVGRGETAVNTANVMFVAA